MPALHSFIVGVLPARTELLKYEAGTTEALKCLAEIRENHKFIFIIVAVVLVIQCVAGGSPSGNKAGAAPRAAKKD